MEFKLALLIIGEAAVMFTLLCGFLREEKIVTAEDRFLGAVRKKIRKKRRRREMKRISKINRRALYRPMKIKDNRQDRKAA